MLTSSCRGLVRASVIHGSALGRAAPMSKLVERDIRALSSVASNRRKSEQVCNHDTLHEQ